MSNNIIYDRKSFIINGERVFLNSASVHYFRMPKDEWREVLVKAKLAGINCIDTYFAWNFHEAEEGVWDFSGDKDCEYFLKLCNELGLWVIARPGPYICAEWDFGALPYWLINKEGIEFRTYNEVFLKYVDLYLDKIMPIITRNQVTKGGSVIMVQVENEYDNLVPEETPEKEAYLAHLKDGLINRGVDVQLIVCNGTVSDAVSCINFWSGADKYGKVLKESQPNAPLFNTEFWTGWFENWGANKATQKTPQLLEKRTMEMIRAGYTGFNQYMFFGGTNFGSFGGRTVNNSDIFMVTSYDYDSPLNEYCSVTPKYYITKKLGYFINTVGQFLINAEEYSSDIRHSDRCSVRERRYHKERIFFVENHADEREMASFTTDDGRTFHVTVNPGQIVPVVVDYKLKENIEITYNSMFFLCENLEGVDTLVVHADKGQRSKLKIHSKDAIKYFDEQLIINTGDNNTVEFDFCHFEDVQELNLKVGSDRLKILVLDKETMDRTWIARGSKGSFLIVNCDDLNYNNEGKISIKILKEDAIVKVYGSNIEDSFTIPKEHIKKAEDNSYEIYVHGSISSPKLPKPLNWFVSKEDIASLESSKKIDKPQGFAEYGQDFGYLLYSVEVYSNFEKTETLIIPHIQDTARVYVNGNEQGLIRDVITGSFNIPLKQGNNTVQLLVQNMGRYNYSHFLGEDKGISDKIYLGGTVEEMRKGWKVESGEIINLDEDLKLSGNPLMIKEFINDGFDRAFLTGSLSEDIWINGNKLDMSKYQQGWHFISVDISKYLVEGINKIEMKYYRSNIVRLELTMFNESSALDAYYVSKAADYKSDKTWEKLNALGSNTKAAPTWYKCSFDRIDIPKDMNLKLKLRMTGMSKGNIWINGIDLGRFWQIGPQEDYKIPRSWLKDLNELVIFDEEGRSPDKVRLLWEESSKGKWF